MIEPQARYESSALSSVILSFANDFAEEDPAVARNNQIIGESSAQNERQPNQEGIVVGPADVDFELQSRRSNS